MNQHEELLQKINNSIVKNLKIKTDLEHKQSEDEQALNAALIAQELNPASALSSKIIDNLRNSVDTTARRITEISRLIEGLQSRKAQEEQNLKHFKIGALTIELKKLDLRFYQAYRERLTHQKAVAGIDKALEPLAQARNELIAGLESLGEYVVAAFDASPEWMNFSGTDVEKNSRRMGLRPWNDVETEAGAEFINMEIARLEKETK